MVSYLFFFEAVTSKLAHIVLINDKNNMCEGISQKFKIDPKGKEYKILQVVGAAYKKCTANEY